MPTWASRSAGAEERACERVSRKSAGRMRGGSARVKLCSDGAAARMTAGRRAREDCATLSAPGAQVTLREVRRESADVALFSWDRKLQRAGWGPGVDMHKEREVRFGSERRITVRQPCEEAVDARGWPVAPEMEEVALGKMRVVIAGSGWTEDQIGPASAEIAADERYRVLRAGRDGAKADRKGCKPRVCVGRIALDWEEKKAVRRERQVRAMAGGPLGVGR